MFRFKLVDSVLQGVTFLSALILLMVFGASGYFFWITVGLIIWILISVVLNFVFSKPVSKIRNVITLILSVLFIIFLTSYLLGVSIPRLNFYFRPLSIVVIITYLFISFLELNKVKSKEEVDLDF